MMEFQEYIRKPFKITAVQVTEENIDEVAKQIGEVVEEDGSKYILVDRRIVPNVYRVYVGGYMARMGDQIRCYTKRVFNKQFVEAAPEVLELVDAMNTKKEKKGG